VGCLIGGVVEWIVRWIVHRMDSSSDGWFVVPQGSDLLRCLADADGDVSATAEVGNLYPSNERERAEVY
jgi:hypothetical protein